VLTGNIKAGSRAVYDGTVGGREVASRKKTDKGEAKKGGLRKIYDPHGEENLREK